MADLNVAVQITAKDAASGPIGAVQTALNGLSGAAAAPIKAIGSLTNALGAIGLAAGGVQALTGAAQGLAGALGVGVASGMEQVRAQLMAFMKDGAAVDKLLGQIRAEADKTPFAFQEMAKATAMLQPAAQASGKDIMALIKQAEILAALNPAEGLTGGAFALREALSGDFVSVMERFNIPRTLINQLKAEGVPAMEIVGEALRRMGADYSLVSNLANTTAGRFSTFQDAIEGLRVIAGQPILAALGTQLDNLSAFVGRNQETLNGLARAIGTGLAGAIRVAGDALGEAMRLFELAAGVWGGLHGDTDALRWGIEGLIDTIGVDLTRVLFSVMHAIRGDFGPAVEFLSDKWLDVQNAFSAFAPTGERAGRLLGFIGDRIADLLPGLATAASNAGTLDGAFDRLAEVVNATSEAMESLIEWVKEHDVEIAALTGVVTAGATAFGLMRLGMLAAAAAAGIQTVATWAAVAAQTALNVALTANPIGIVIVALAGLAAALTTLWHTNDGFREGVISAWTALTAAAGAIKDVIVTKFSEIAAFIASLPERFRANAVAAGASIVQGLVDGMNPTNVIKAGFALGQAAASATRQALESRSPSRVFEEIGAEVVAGFVGGITDNLSPVDRAAAEMAERLEDAEREHAIRMERLWEDAGRTKGKARTAALERIERAEEDHQRRIEDINDSGAARIVQLEREQAQRRANAVMDFLRGMEDLEREVERKSGDIEARLRDGLAAAASDAGRAIADTMRRAAEQWQSATESLGLSRLIRGRRDEFGAGQDAEARAFREQRDAAEMQFRWEEDKLEANRRYKEALEKEQLRFSRELRRVDSKEEEDRLKEETRVNREKIHEQLVADTQAADRRWEKAREDAARRKRLDEEERAFRQRQEQARRAFEDGLEDEALRRMLDRIITERDSRITEIRTALAEKQREIETQATKEREALARSYEERVADLRDKLLAKVGPLTDEAQATLARFLDNVAGHVQRVTAGIIANTSAATTSIAALGSGGDGGSGRSAAEQWWADYNFHRNMGSELAFLESTPTATLREAGVLKPGEKLRNLDSGGWLMEPIVGRGLRSGDVYNLAEKRPEYLMGGAESARMAGGLSVTINIAGSLIHEKDVARAVMHQIKDLMRSGATF